MREKYESLSLATLKDLAKARGLKGVSALRKPELIERMLHEDELEGETKKQETVREKPQQSEVEGNGERIPQYNKTPERTQYHAPAEAVQLDSGERADGILEVTGATGFFTAWPTCFASSEGSQPRRSAARSRLACMPTRMREPG